MNKKKRVQEYHSFEEYQKKFFPKRGENSLLSTANPQEFGANLAQESLDKFKHILLQK